MALAIEQFQSEINKLCAAHEVESLELFGSSMTSDFDPDSSDVDFLVVFRRSNHINAFDQYMGLKLRLEDLLGRPVDLVERKAIRNPYFLRSATAHTKQVYAA